MRTAYVIEEITNGAAGFVTEEATEVRTSCVTDENHLRASELGDRHQRIKGERRHTVGYSSSDRSEHNPNKLVNNL